MSTTTTYTGVRIVDMPDLGAVTDNSSVVGEHAGSGRFAATALRTYVAGLGTTNVGRNLIHNPLFNIGQRGTGPFITSTYTLDRWVLATNLDTVSVIQTPLGETNRAAIGDDEANVCLAASVTGNAGAAAYTQIYQSIENVRRLAGKTVTVSLWAHTFSGTGKLGVAYVQSFGTGGSPSTSVGLTPVGATPTLTTLPVRYSFTFTLPGMSGKTVGTNGDSYSRLTFFCSSGATNNGVASGIGVQTAGFILWGVQLEVGSVATPLEKPDPQYELANCQRFFQLGQMISSAYNAAGANVTTSINLPVTMRATPTVVVTPAFAGNVTAIAGAAYNATSLSFSATVTAANTNSTFGCTYTASADL